jgi:acyl-CoA synthetase (AMP-forming)/AMP-acid ligase II
VPAKVLETFSRLLTPGALIHTPYGATEALPVCSISHAEVLSETRERTDRGEGVCVGWPVTGMRVAVIDVTDEPIARWSEDLRLPPGVVGEIVVKGPVVNPEYVNRPEATAKAKIPDPSGGLWHRMGDLGLIDEAGRVWFRGRKAHRVVAPSGTFDTIFLRGGL